MKKITCLIWLLPSLLMAQVTHPSNGVSESKPEYYALKNATIVISPTQTLDRASILVKDGRIEDVGRFVNFPSGTVVYDCAGKTILPGFIDLNTQLGMPEPQRKPFEFRPQLESKTPGSYYWNESIHPEFNSAEHYTSSESNITKYREMGFGLVLSHLNDGIAQGTGALISLHSDVHKSIVVPKAGAFYSFDKGASRQTYPSSQMGSIALLRQAFYDAQWYGKNKQTTKDLSLESLLEQNKLVQFFTVEENYEHLRAKKIADEFQKEFIYIGAGDEYVIAQDLAAFKAKLVIPAYFPEAYDVHDPFVNRQIPLSLLQKWELAPYNAAVLRDNKVEFAVSSHGNKSSSEFWTNIKKMIEAGLKAEDLLAALTTTPAKWLGIEADYGTLEKGKVANFVVYNENPLETKARVLESWIQGEANLIGTKQEADIRGDYNLLIDGKAFPIEIRGTVDSPEGTILVKKNGENEKIKAFIELSQTDVVIQFPIHNDYWSGSVNLKGKFNVRLGIFEGSGQVPSGAWILWSGIRNEKPEKDADNGKYVVNNEKPNLQYPLSAYGLNKKAGPQKILIKNATVWTNTDKGKIENCSVLISNGKIIQVGKNVGGDGAKEIDGTGLHITPGIIDEHSHIAISKGVNEGGQSISAEVSIGDVVDPSDINIYRQLSGGVTAAQLLHGSANAIGGQSALIKLKWGVTPEEMLIPNAPKFIKFALGENVKQANWGDFNTIRFPQTRMGVEQVFYDGFLRAKKYELEKQSGNYRRDLELDVLLEILKSQRHISCHSYVQSEVNMLMHVADSMGFKVNTFTHILEGYKVADKMAQHGAGGSTFADWWAYKYEVKDAIPYNAFLMHDEGVVVAINSDDAEMGRRLNQEAGKTMKYGGLNEIEALKMVTLNPAKLLHLDDRMGKIQTGMDGDVVVWSAHPLSVEARAEYTIIDGTIYFDRSKLNELVERDNATRARIIAKMLAANKKGDKKTPYVKPEKKHYHCDTIGEEGTTKENQH